MVAAHNLKQYPGDSLSNIEGIIDFLFYLLPCNHSWDRLITLSSFRQMLLQENVFIPSKACVFNIVVSVIIIFYGMGDKPATQSLLLCLESHH